MLVQMYEISHRESGGFLLLDVYLLYIGSYVLYWVIGHWLWSLVMGLAGSHCLVTRYATLEPRSLASR